METVQLCKLLYTNYQKFQGEKSQKSLSMNIFKAQNKRMAKNKRFEGTQYLKRPLMMQISK
jgi:hypothetical protein